MVAGGIVLDSRPAAGNSAVEMREKLLAHGSRVAAREPPPGGLDTDPRAFGDRAAPGAVAADPRARAGDSRRVQLFAWRGNLCLGETHQPHTGRVAALRDFPRQHAA